MPLIAISSDQPGLGREIAEQVAQVLGYKLLSREFLAEVAREHDLDQGELVKALDEPPGLLGMRARRRRELLSCLQSSCLERLLEDDTVCQGLAAHLYIIGVSHGMRVRVLQDPQRMEEALNLAPGTPPAKVQKALERQENDRRRWSQEAFDADETDPGNYDMVLSLSTLEKQQVVDIICDAADYPKFQAMTYSRKCLADKALAARVRVALQKRFPDIRLRVTDGIVVAQVQSLKRDQRKKQQAVRELASQVSGVTHVEVHVINDIFGQAALSER